MPGDVLAKAPISEQLQGALKRFGDYLDPSTLAAANKTLKTLRVKSIVQDIYAGVPTVNALGQKDPHGIPDPVMLAERKRKYADDPDFDLIDERVGKRQKVDEAAMNAVATQMANKVQAQAEDQTGPLGRGYFDMSRVDPNDYEMLRRTAPGYLRTFNRVAADVQRKDAAGLQKQSETRLIGDLTALANKDPAKFATLTPTTMFDRLSKVGDDGEPLYHFTDLRRVPEILKQLQGQHKQDNLSWIDGAVTKQLTGNPLKLDPKDVRASPYYSYLVKAVSDAVKRGELKDRDPAKLDTIFKQEFQDVPHTYFPHKRQIDLDIEKAKDDVSQHDVRVINGHRWDNTAKGWLD